MATVSALVGIVEGRRAVEQVVATDVGPVSTRAQAPDHLQHHAGAVDHGGIDDLAGA